MLTISATIDPSITIDTNVSPPTVIFDGTFCGELSQYPPIWYRRAKVFYVDGKIQYEWHSGYIDNQIINNGVIDTSIFPTLNVQVSRNNPSNYRY